MFKQKQKPQFPKPFVAALKKEEYESPMLAAVHSCHAKLWFSVLSKMALVLFIRRSPLTTIHFYQQLRLAIGDLIFNLLVSQTSP